MADPFTTAFAARLYELQKRELKNDAAPPFAELPERTRTTWLEHASAVHYEYGEALRDVMQTLGARS